MEHFGTEHLLVLACTAIAGLALAGSVRTWPNASRWRGVEVAMALLLLAIVAFDPLRTLIDGSFNARTHLPLHASEITALVAGVALLTRRQLVFELAWFWGLAGGISALVTPDLGSIFPQRGWWLYILAHSLVVIAALELGVGRRMRPRVGSALWAAAGAVVLLAIAGVASVLSGGNYMYTREPPGAGTPLDVMGDWPWYLGGGALIALLIFAVLEAPFRLADWRRRPSEPRRA